MYLGIGILHLVQLKLRYISLREHEKYRYINRIYRIVYTGNGNNTCKVCNWMAIHKDNLSHGRADYIRSSSGTNITQG